MLTKKTMTIIGVALAPVTVVILDTLFVGPGSSNELVEAIRSSGATAFVAWTVALFVGHWFHPGDDLEPLFGLLESPWNYVVFGGLTLVLGVLLLPGWIDVAGASDWLPATLAAAGFGVGSILWPV